MKKYFFTLSLLITCLNAINAQDINDNSIGLRFGGGNGSAGEISYQKALGSNNRLEIDLGLANDFTDFKATGLYQWVWNLEDRFNWYTGFGGGLVVVLLWFCYDFVVVLLWFVVVLWWNRLRIDLESTLDRPDTPRHA